MLSYSPYYPFYSIKKPVEETFEITLQYHRGIYSLSLSNLFVVSFESECDSTGVFGMSLQSLLSEYQSWDVSVINLSIVS